MRLTLRSQASTTSFQRWACCRAVGSTWRSPWKPMSSTETVDVRPFSCSCLWRSTRLRAPPRPSSRPPAVRTPMSVDLPLSTLPIMATRTSRASHVVASAAGALSGLSGAWSTSSSSAPPPKRLLRDRSRADGTDTVDASLTTDSVLSVRARTILASRCGLADGGVACFSRARAARPRRDSKGDGLAEFPTRTPPPTTRKVVAAMRFNRRRL
mmetsp:Transcript_29734/g.97245  ORF Transcript_29734/g.97245 Transcript_29734/m.97245 type:complete len:212 (+) Transcript_29734:226-861(+)